MIRFLRRLFCNHNYMLVSKASRDKKAIDDYGFYLRQDTLRCEKCGKVKLDNRIVIDY